MPVIPDFSSFAATPPLGQDYLGGAQLNEQIAQHAAELQLQRETLAQHAQQAQMEHMAKQADFQQNQLRYQQQMAIDKAYKDATIGWRQAQIDEQEKRVSIAAQDASRKMQVQEQYKNRFSAYTDPDYMGEIGEDVMEPEAAARRAILELDPALFGGACSQAVKGSGMTDFGEATSVPGLPDQYKQVQTGAGSRRIIHVPEALTGSAKPAEQAPGLPDNYKLFGGKLVKLSDPIKDIQAELRPLLKEHESDDVGAGKAQDLKNGKKLTPTGQSIAEKWKARQAEIDKLREQIDELRAKTSLVPTNAPAAYVPAGLGGTTNTVAGFRVIRRQ
jgi:hypothetical protein